MSICVLVKVGEGLVLASDSASAVAGAPVTPNGKQGPQGILKVFFNANKIFQIRKLPVGVMSWGAGAFQERTVASLVEEFENLDEVKKISRQNLDIKELSNELWKSMKQKSDDIFNNIPTKGRPKTGLLVCGYSKDNFFPEEYAMIIPTEKASRIRPDRNGKPDFGANWYGLTDAIIRFHHGRDDRVFEVLKNIGIDQKEIDNFKEKITKDIQYPVLFQAMSLGDAINYAEFVVQLTIARFRFVVGAELCGGPIDVAVITRKEGFNWIKNKKTVLERREKL